MVRNIRDGRPRRRGARLCRGWRAGAEHGQDRHAAADDRSAAVDRRADHRGDAALHGAQHGDTVAGKKIEIVLRDDGAISDNSKRLAQELIVNQKVNFVVGFGLTPNAFAVAPLATEVEDAAWS